MFKPLLVIPVICVLSIYLMFHTFSYNSLSGQFQVAGKVWSDFGSHIPLIRSFTYGANWPPRYPLFPGSAIKYHYLFYSVVGWTERLKVPLDISLNLFSSAGMAALMILIFVFSAKLFRNLSVGFLSLLFFIFNGSLSFLDFFSKHPLSSLSLKEIVHNSAFPAFAPWNQSLITAFWNLNIYTNQRHLGLSFAVTLLLIFILCFPKTKLIYLSGFILGSLLLLNQACFLIGLLFCLIYFIFSPETRIKLILSSAGSLPWVLISLTTQSLSPGIFWQPGFLITPPLTYLSLFKYWFYNFGIHLFLIPLGFLIAPPKTRLVFFPALIIFIIANLWRFSPDMINNHKFFNFFLIIGTMFSAWFITAIFQKNILGKFAAFILVISLTLGGMIDIFPVINDTKILFSDSKTNPDIRYFLDNTPPKSIVLNSFWFYHPASLAGRSIYNGYSYFTWSYGYDQVAREKETIRIYSSDTKISLCQSLKTAKIDYIEYGPGHESFISIRPDLWLNELIPDYSNNLTGFTVYSVQDNCSDL